MKSVRREGKGIRARSGRRAAAWKAAVFAGLTAVSGALGHADQKQPVPPPEGALRQFEFHRAEGISIPVLQSQVFQQLYGGNPEVPKTDEGIRHLARRLYTLSRTAGLPLQEECAEHEFGRLFAALQNPTVADETREAVDAEADATMPSLPKTYTSGHFRFFYTDNNSDTTQNVTLADIKATAEVMNAAWNDFAARFREPKHYLAVTWSGGGGIFGFPSFEVTKRIDVKVYNLGPNLLGVTSSGWDHIELDARRVVADACKRQTTAVHELFHRVQYAYGYVSGTAGMKWAVEATASWSQKYRASHVGDWMQRMNSGLLAADTALLERSYDACHFWVYLGQRGGSEWQTIRDVWATYAANGKQMKQAVQSVIHNRIGSGYSFDAIVGWWSFANFYKDLETAAAHFDYAEDDLTQTCGGGIFGPLASVMPVTRTLSSQSSETLNGNVRAHGADYYVFNIAAGGRRVKIDFTGASANFGYAVIEIRDNKPVHYVRSPAGSRDSFSYDRTIASGELDKIAVVVIGNPGGGDYSLKVTNNPWWLADIFKFPTAIKAAIAN